MSTPHKPMQDIAVYASEAIAEPIDAYWSERRQASNHIRKLLNHLQTTAMSANSLKQLNSGLEQLLNSLPEEEKLYGRKQWLNAEKFGHNGVMHAETTPILGASNPVSPELSIWFNEAYDKALGKLRFNWLFEGGAERAHGGSIAAVFDEFMATAVALTGKACVTAYLKTDYKSFTPIDRELRLEAAIEKIEGKKVFVKGEMRAGDTITAICEGLFIIVADLPKRR
jgi:hypothetical protein